MPQGFPRERATRSGAGTRELVVIGTPFVVIYRIVRDRVEIIRLLHGAQKYPFPEQ